MPLSYVNPILVSTAFPAFARVQNQDDVLRWGYAKILHYLSAVTFPIMAGILVVAPLFVPLIYGSQWLPAVPVVQIFCLLGAVKTLGNPIGSVILAKGRADLVFWMNVVAICGYSISNLIGVHWGINGVAASSLIFSCLVLLPIDFYLRWITIRMTVREYWEAIKRPTASTIIMLMIIFPLYFLATAGSNINAALILLVLSGSMIYAGVMLMLDRSLFIELWGYLKPTFQKRV
jgi:O-antigen/teichoic acid export membrane protein